MSEDLTHQWFSIPQDKPGIPDDIMWGPLNKTTKEMYTFDVEEVKIESNPPYFVVRVWGEKGIKCHERFDKRWQAMQYINNQLANILYDDFDASKP